MIGIHYSVPKVQKRQDYRVIVKYKLYNSIVFQLMLHEKLFVMATFFEVVTFYIYEVTIIVIC